MIVDTSAIVAILRGEADADDLVVALSSANRPRMSAATYLETVIVVDASRDPVLSGRLDDLMAAADIGVVAVTSHHAELARVANRSFGMVTGRPKG